MSRLGAVALKNRLASAPGPFRDSSRLFFCRLDGLADPFFVLRAGLFGRFFLAAHDTFDLNAEFLTGGEPPDGVPVAQVVDTDLVAASDRLQCVPCLDGVDEFSYL